MKSISENCAVTWCLPDTNCVVALLFSVGKRESRGNGWPTTLCARCSGLHNICAERKTKGFSSSQAVVMRAMGSSGTTVWERTAIIRAEEVIMNAGPTERRNVVFVTSRKMGRIYGTH